MAVNPVAVITGVDEQTARTAMTRSWFDAGAVKVAVDTLLPELAVPKEETGFVNDTGYSLPGIIPGTGLTLHLLRW